MTKDRYPYPPDEFDAVDPTSRPAGAHLAPPTTWSKVWPYLVVLVVAPLVGIGVIQLLSHYQQSADDASTGPTTTVSATAGGDATPSEIAGEGSDPAATGDATPDASQTTETGPIVNYEARVICYNAARVAGMAGRCADKLGEAGWTNAESADYEGSQTTPPSAVYYTSPDMEATAQQVASDLGLATVELSADQNPIADVSVVLRSDYTED